MKSNKGFSLVELIVVIAIMAIIAAVAVPTYSAYITKAETSKNDQVVNDAIYAAQLACIEYGCTATVTVSSSDAKIVFNGADAAAAAAQVASIVGGDAETTEGTLDLTADDVVDTAKVTATEKTITADGKVD